MRRIGQCAGCAALGHENEMLRQRIAELENRLEEMSAQQLNDTLTLPRIRSLDPQPKRRRRRSMVG